MSAVELAIEKVKTLDEAHARELLKWLDARASQPGPAETPNGAASMLGFARRFHPQPRSAAEWMAELREGETTFST